MLGVALMQLAYDNGAGKSFQNNTLPEHYASHHCNFEQSTDIISFTSVKPVLVKLHQLSRLFDSSICIFSLFTWKVTGQYILCHQQTINTLFQHALNQFSNILTCHFAFDKAKK